MEAGAAVHLALKLSVWPLHVHENSTCIWVPVLRVNDLRPQCIDTAPESNWEIPYVDSRMLATPATVDNQVPRGP